MTQLAAGTAGFNETALRNTLRGIAARARATEDEILTREEETRLRDFRDRMANRDLTSVIKGSATLNRALRRTDRRRGWTRRPDHRRRRGRPPGTGEHPPARQHVNHQPQLREPDFAREREGVT